MAKAAKAQGEKKQQRGLFQELLSLRVLVIFIVGSLLLFDVGRYTYTSIESAIANNLSQWLVAELKVGRTEIDQWRSEQIDTFRAIVMSGEAQKFWSSIVENPEESVKELWQPDSNLGKQYSTLKDSFKQKGYHSVFVLNDNREPLLNEIPKFVFSYQRATIDLFLTDLDDESMMSEPVWLKVGDGTRSIFVVAQKLEISYKVKRKAYTKKIIVGSFLPVASTLAKILDHGNNDFVQPHIFDEERRLLSQIGPQGSTHVLPSLPCGPQVLPENAPVLIFDKYTNFAGSVVVASCRWYGDYKFGLILEVPVQHAFLTLRTVTWAFGVLFLLLVIVSFGALFGSMLLMVVSSRSNQDRQKLGQYTLEHKIGKGGMGEVYLARHALLRRPVALKFLRSKNVSSDVLDQFEREVQLTSQLTHPNTIAIYDYGRSPDDIFYYVMEFLDGVNLKSLIKSEGTLSEGRVIHVLDQICGSLAEAHRVGLIHRDIKPANIMLCRLGGMHDVVKVLDFGLIKQLSDRGSAKTTVVGTVRAMAPEVVNNPGSETPQSDIFSLGVLGYFLLTGHYLFDESVPREYLKRLLIQEPVRPSVRIGRPLSSDLEQLIISCLNRNPLLRPGSVKALQYSLRTCQAAGSWTEAHAASWWEKQSEFPTLEDTFAASHYINETEVDSSR